ncbi:Glycosyl transferases group 1 [Variovorax sp. PBL-H6]|uniref:glycosyltransferase family 4 protein n=1 Tax=Variovorax sp. PBL-H6 TaxID=434009 RepID=UPI001319B7F3|nr:glycosyltransferase family 4 protein [Variovorax sp. PBL-H6]VTU17434.1 Glycosyl transferases group 1 [Variovorax sp. PBL-H6]
MKFILFSPLANTSAIGRVTALIAPSLMQLGHELTLVRTEQAHLLAVPPHAVAAPVIDWTDEAAVNEAIEAADALVYQIGNSYEYHCGGLHWLQKQPGIVCLHDFVVAHLFAAWAETRRAQAEQVLGSWYGKAVADVFFAARDHREFIDSASRDHPMTEWVCAMANGVVSHSHWGMPRVMRSCAGPVRVVPLAYNAPSAQSVTDQGTGSELVQLLTVGHANVNKRIDSVIRAIGSSALLRSRVQYQLCGLIDPRYALELAQLARSLRVLLTITGEAEDTVLQAAMNDADIVCCLRWPSLEAASATAIEGLLYGKAVVVTDTGFYGELPDDCVCKVSPDDEISQLRSKLEQLVSNPSARQDMAARGQRWARQTFHADGYARGLVEMSQLVATARPILEMAKTLSASLADWGASSTLIDAEDIAGPLALFQIPRREAGSPFTEPASQEGAKP